MSTENHNPDVVVVGMPSCGKTVFFTVLGKKFTNLVDGRRGAPIGFRLATCDGDTAKVVNVAYDRLRNGSWPEATKAGQIMPLRWEVFTGRRRIFELFSMDVAGETFKRAFGIGDDDGGSGKAVSKGTKAKADSGSGDELYRDESVSDAGPENVRETEEDKAAELLKGALRTAKVVCFMVNVAVPSGRRSGGDDDADEKKRLRFRSSVMNMYLSLRGSPELSSKAIIVLTQTHRHQGEIERAGGPAMYLADVCGGEASELCNLAKENDIPVIAVSAINETARGDNELPEIASPDRIPSSGLFGFLLTVSGKVAEGDSLSRVKDAYLDFLRERMEYLKSPCQRVRIRFVQARKCQAAASGFIDACKRYLDDDGNLADRISGGGLSFAAKENYRIFTKNDPEVKSAADTEYAVRDELWDRVLRKVAIADESVTPDEVYDRVREGLERAFPDKSGNAANEEFVFGFGEEDLVWGSEASTFDQWIELNLADYRRELKANVEDLEKVETGLLKTVDALEACVGESDFDDRLSSARKLHDEFCERMSALRAEWLGGDALALPTAECMEKEVAEKFVRVEEFVGEHERRRQKEQNRLRRRKATVVLVVLLAAAVSVLCLARYYCNRRNREIVQEIGRAIGSADYEGARGLYGSMYSIDWLGIDREDCLSSGFAERLELSAQDHDVRKHVEALCSEFENFRAWLNEVDVSLVDVEEASNRCASAVAAYQALPREGVSLDEIIRQDVDLKARVDVARECEFLLKNTNEALGKIREGANERKRKSDFKREIKVAEDRLEKVRSEIDSLDMSSVSNRVNEVVGRIRKLEELSAGDKADMEMAGEFVNMARHCICDLQARDAELHAEIFSRAVGEVRTTMTSGSLSQAWENYDQARGLQDGENDRKKLSDLKRELVSLTLVSYDRELTEIEARSEAMNAEGVSLAEIVSGIRQLLKSIEEMRNGLRKRVPETEGDLGFVLTRIEHVREKLPVVVQIDGVQPGSAEAVNVKSDGVSPSVVNGTSLETRKGCVYMLIPRKELSSGNSRFVRVVDVDGNVVHGLVIQLSKLHPGLNRFGVKGNMLDGKEAVK